MLFHRELEIVRMNFLNCLRKQGAEISSNYDFLSKYYFVKYVE